MLIILLKIFITLLPWAGDSGKELHFSNLEEK